MYELESNGAPGELVIDVDHVVNPARLGQWNDARDLGLRIGGMSWRTAAAR